MLNVSVGTAVIDRNVSIAFSYFSIGHISILNFRMYSFRVFFDGASESFAFAIIIDGGN